MLVHAHCCPHADTHQFISIMSLELVSATEEVRTHNVEILNQNTKYSSIHILIPIPLLSYVKRFKVNKKVQRFKVTHAA